MALNDLTSSIYIYIVGENQAYKALSEHLDLCILNVLEHIIVLVLYKEHDWFSCVVVLLDGLIVVSHGTHRHGVDIVRVVEAI